MNLWNKTCNRGKPSFHVYFGLKHTDVGRQALCINPSEQSTQTWETEPWYTFREKKARRRVYEAWHDASTGICCSDALAALPRFDNALPRHLHRPWRARPHPFPTALQEFESMFHLRPVAAENEDFLYRAYPKDWTVARKPKLGPPKVRGCLLAR